MPPKRRPPGPETVVPIDGVRPGRVPCPVCGRTMQVEGKGKVTVDVCPEHGIWLDNGELDAICRAIRAGAASSRHMAVRLAREAGRQHGARYRFWSLFMD
ncbi:MAG: zf-TFIIB domain-containing protein [Candidatus Brocadiae bacterium]|nr:zf-TFIIB domain-containing protein [Candidatus Brocadiia bacterium]